MACIDFRRTLAYTSGMNFNRAILLAAVVCLAAGCSSVPTKINKGPVQARTYSLMPSKAPRTVVVNKRREAVHQMIQDAIARTLEQKGLGQVPTGGDVQVAYMVVVADNVSTATYDEYFGYGRDASALSEKAHKAVSRSKSRELLEVGAIVIDILDPRDSRVLFRSYAYMDVANLTSENRAERIQVLVASCLGNLQVRP